MPRIRTIKPEFFTSDTVSQLPMRTRLTWIGLWTHSDDYGRSRDNVKLIKAAVWPLDDVSLTDIQIDLNTLADRGLIFRYAVDGKTYIAVSGWTEHQKVDRPSKSPIPAPSNGIPAQDTRETLASPREDASRARDRKGKERKGKEGSEIASDSRASPGPNHPRPEPPNRCPEHKFATKPPNCGNCADTRKAHELWSAAKAERDREAPRCPKHRGQPAHNCAQCRGEALGDPDA